MQRFFYHILFLFDFFPIILKHFKKFCTAPNTNHVDKYWFTHTNPQGRGGGGGAVTDKFDDRAGRERESERGGGSLDKDKSYDKWQALGLGE